MLDGDDAVERRKERRVHSAPVFSAALMVGFSLLNTTVFSYLTWLMIPAAWLILSGLDDNPKKEEGRLIYR